MAHGQLVDEDGRRWLLIEADNGEVWQEPISEWEYVIDLVRGERYFRHRRDPSRIVREV